MTIEGSVTAQVFRDFLRWLIAGTGKVFLIVDGHPTDKAKLVRKFVEDNAEYIEFFFLPAYMSELNPDELTRAHVKTKIAKTTAQTKAKLKAAVDRVMHLLQKTPNIVASFFHVPTCA